jgi:arylesterase / paraoxonase
MEGTITVLELQEGGWLKELSVIKTTYPIDNLAADAKGDIYAACFPKVLEVMAVVDDPFQKTATVTVLRIKKVADGYRVEKVLEDGNKKVLSMATTATHDAKTGRIFMGSEFIPQKNPPSKLNFCFLFGLYNLLLFTDNFQVLHPHL